MTLNEPAVGKGVEDDGAELVETGGFRVDRERALEKIRSYRRGDVGSVWLFLRAASAAGSENVAVRRTPDGFTVEFDAPPFRESVLRDPYEALFAEAGADAERWLALGLIHAFGPGLRLVTVESGLINDRRRLSVRDVGQEVVASVPGEGARTVVRVKAAHSFERHWRHPLSEAEQAVAPRCLVWGRMRADVERGYDSFSSLPPDPPEAGEVAWEEGSALGRLWVPAARDGLVDVHVAGVYAGTVELGGRIPAVGKLDHPGLGLDASLAALVRNEALVALLESAHRHAGLLVVKAAREHVRAMAELAPLLASSRLLASLWRSFVSGEADAESQADRYMAEAGAIGPYSRSETVRRARLAARSLVWLRRVTARTGPEDGWAGDLETCPLAFGSGFAPLALKDLRGVAGRRDGVVPEFWHKVLG